MDRINLLSTIKKVLKGVILRSVLRDEGSYPWIKADPSPL
jgi:hypothetical protein